MAFDHLWLMGDRDKHSVMSFYPQNSFRFQTCAYWLEPNCAQNDFIHDENLSSIQRFVEKSVHVPIS